MNTSNIKSRDVKKCMKEIFKHCDFETYWKDESLSEYCSNPQNKAILHILESEEQINLISDDAYNIYAISITGNGSVYFLEKREKIKEKIIGFVLGVLTTVTAQILFSLIN